MEAHSGTGADCFVMRPHSMFAYPRVLLWHSGQRRRIAAELVKLPWETAMGKLRCGKPDARLVHLTMYWCKIVVTILVCPLNSSEGSPLRGANGSGA